jgi:hypothetical protein
MTAMPLPIYMATVATSCRTVHHGPIALLDCGVVDRVADQADKRIQEERHSSKNDRGWVLAGKDFDRFAMEILT